MRTARALGYVTAAGALFAAGWVFGAATDVVASLSNRPASMLTIGGMRLATAVPDVSLRPRGAVLVVERVVIMTAGTAKSPPVVCEGRLAELRAALGYRAPLPGQPRVPSELFSRLFLAAEEDPSATSTIARRHDIDAATVVRVAVREPSLGIVAQCEGPLVAKP